jgi:hypothetical protein
MRTYFVAFVFSIACIKPLQAQELYVFTEPASNMPAGSISIKLSEHFVSLDRKYNRSSHRLMPELMLGISKKLMIHAYGTLSNMHTDNFRGEAIGTYIKYRFLSHDDIHRHFRMAVFADASTTSAPFHYDEVSLMGDKSGIEAGVIATQLWNKLAVSGTISHTQVLDPSRNNDVIYIPARNYQSLNYSLSAGLLVLPKNYTDYRQTNLNLYLEVLGQRVMDNPAYFVDIAPAVQLIFNSNTKINLGLRSQLAGDMDRMTKTSWLISLERNFLGVLGKH